MDNRQKLIALSCIVTLVVAGLIAVLSVGLHAQSQAAHRFGADGGSFGGAVPANEGASPPSTIISTTLSSTEAGTLAERTKCVPVQNCTRRNVLDPETFARYDSSLAFSREFLISRTLIRAQQDLFYPGGPRCAFLTSQTPTRLEFDINALGTTPNGLGGTLVLNVVDSMANPLNIRSALYTGQEMPGVGVFQFNFAFTNDGQTVERPVEMFLQVPNSAEFLPFPILQEVSQKEL